jgi:hypothetical protein
MNVVFPSFCILAAGVAGYVLEPQLESSLLPSKHHAAKTVEAPTAVAEPAPAPVVKKVDPTPPPVAKPTPPVVVENTPPEPVPEPPVEPTKPEVAGADTPPAPSGDDLLPPPPPLGDLGGGNGDDAKNKAIVELMKSSITDGQVTEFTVSQVLGWKAGGKEVFDGETYQVGLAAYSADTIFGKKTLEAKALIKDGKVVKWVWAKSKLEIK